MKLVCLCCDLDRPLRLHCVCKDLAMTQSQKRPPGRPPSDENARRSARVELRLTQAQREKLERLGGADWVRTRIDRARDPAFKE